MPSDDIGTGERSPSDVITSDLGPKESTEGRVFTNTNVIGGRYVVMDQLGVGGMARILKVRHLSLGKEFALKIIQSGSLSDERLRKHLLREARVISLMEHPHIVQVTDFGEDEHFGIFIVMEYLKGETLFELLDRKGRLRLPQTLEIAQQMCEALHYMHEKGVIHRDLKPENIFLCRQPAERRQRPHVKIIDFGLAGQDAKITVQATSGALGTPSYMSPEQIKGNAPRVSNDIYAVGILLYEMLTGKPPFKGHLDEVISGHLYLPPAPISERIGEEIDAQADRLIARALAKEPSQRQQSTTDLLYEIRTVMDMLGVERRDRRGSAVPVKPAKAVEREPAFQRGWQVFEHSPCPQVMVHEDGHVLAANQALASFVKQPLETLVGSWLADSRLGKRYPTLLEDIGAVVAAQQPRQHMITFTKQEDNQEDRSVRLLIWWVPIPDAPEQPPKVGGIIVPLPTDDQLGTS